MALCALALAASGCGGGDDNAGGGVSTQDAHGDETYTGETYTEDTYTRAGFTDDTSTEATAAPDRGCEARYPLHVRIDPPDVTACSSKDGLSVHIKNVSAKVLLFWPTYDDPPTEIALDAGGMGSAGVEAARAATGSGWLGETFVLSIDQSLTATSESPISLQFRTDVGLTAKANVARHVADWVASRFQTRGRAFAQRVQSCATAAEGVASGTYIEDVMRSGLETPVCVNVLRDVLGEQRVPPWAVPRARAEILKLAKPVMKDELVTFVTRIAAHR
jgi:hypothetical protein